MNHCELLVSVTSAKRIRALFHFLLISSLPGRLYTEPLPKTKIWSKAQHAYSNAVK